MRFYSTQMQKGFYMKQLRQMCTHRALENYWMTQTCTCTMIKKDITVEMPVMSLNETDEMCMKKSNIYKYTT